MLYELITFLLFFLLFLIILSIIFYRTIKRREYFFSSTTNGEQLTYTVSNDGFHKLGVNDTNLTFLPFEEDKNNTIRGDLILTTYSTNKESQYYKIKVMNGKDKLSDGIYEIKHGVDYNYINFKVGGKDDRKLTIDVKRYNKVTQKTDNTVPDGIKLIKAYGYYY